MKRERMLLLRARRRRRRRSPTGASHGTGSALYNACPQPRLSSLWFAERGRRQRPRLAAGDVRPGALPPPGDAPDLPGAGGSAKSRADADRYSPGFFGRFAVTFLDALGIERAAVGRQPLGRPRRPGPGVGAARGEDRR